MFALAFAIAITASVLALIAVALLAGAGINLLTRVPYAPTPHAQVERVLDYIRLRPGQRLYDLGCGDGRVVFAASRRGAVATGYELQPIAYLRAMVMQMVRFRSAQICYGSYEHANLTDADVIFCFLVDVAMPKVAEIISAQCPPGCTVVSYGFPLPNWQADMVLEPLKPNGSKIFLYQKIGTPSQNEKMNN